MTVKRDKFDFEIGYLIKSPCKECLSQKDLPQCADQCSLLDKIRILLSRGVSCTGKQSFFHF